MRRFHMALLGLITITGVLIPATAAQAADPAVANRTAAAAAQQSYHVWPATPQGVQATSRTVSPRVRCGGFNGHVIWSVADIEIYGSLWNDACSNNTSLWLSWHDYSCPNDRCNFMVAEVFVNGETESVPLAYYSATYPGSIAVTVCSTDGGWHCGTPQYV